MATSRRVYLTVAFALVALLTLSVLVGLSNSANGTADTAIAPNVCATIDYSDLLQYEWPQAHGDPAFTRFSAGPAPEAPDILWKTTVKGIQSYVSAFNARSSAQPQRMLSPSTRILEASFGIPPYLLVSGGQQYTKSMKPTLLWENMVLI
jgi:hypothetical protein